VKQRANSIMIFGNYKRC